MTHDEMIAVIQAHKEGKKIQMYNKEGYVGEGGEIYYRWVDVANNAPKWDFLYFDYRIKPEPHYRPFKNAEEVREAIKEKGYYVRWKEDGRDYIVGAVCDDYIQPYQDDTYTLAEAFDSYTWPDGMPFGVKED